MALTQNTTRPMMARGEKLDEARAHHDVMIQSDQGDMFLLTLVTNTRFQNYLSHLDIGLTREEIVSSIREVRER